MYKITHYSPESKDSMNYLIDHMDELSMLIEQNFGERIGPSYFDEVSDVFIAHDDDKIIGCAFIRIEHDIIECIPGSDIPTYSEVSIENYNKYFSLNRILYPVISGLCRNNCLSQEDDKYKGVGTLIIQAICEHYENVSTCLNQDSEYIYLIVGSGRHKLMDHSNELEKTEYYTANRKLIDYYVKNNFEEIKDCYHINSMELCPFEIVMRKKLNKSEELKLLIKKQKNDSIYGIGIMVSIISFGLGYFYDRIVASIVSLGTDYFFNV